MCRFSLRIFKTISNVKIKAAAREREVRSTRKPTASMWNFLNGFARVWFSPFYIIVFHKLALNYDASFISISLLSVLPSHKHVWGGIITIRYLVLSPFSPYSSFQLTRSLHKFIHENNNNITIFSSNTSWQRKREKIVIKSNQIKFWFGWKVQNFMKKDRITTAINKIRYKFIRFKCKFQHAASPHSHTDRNIRCQKQK